MKMQNRLVSSTVVALLATTGIALAQPADTGGSATSANSPAAAASGAGAPAEPVTQSTIKPAALVPGWNYRTCSFVWTYFSGGNYYVQTHNSDGSNFWAVSASATPNAFQAMLIRGCRNQGAAYGVRVDNVSTGHWNAVVGY